MRSAAFRYLERYSASTQSLRQFLKSRVRKTININEIERQLAYKWIESLIESLTERKFLDDRSFAEIRARALFERGASTRRIIALLTEKGIDHSLITKALNTVYADYELPDLVAAIRYAKRKRIGPFRNQSVRNKNKQRDLGMLARGGFNFAVSSTVIDSANADQLESQIIDV